MCQANEALVSDAFLDRGRLAGFTSSAQNNLKRHGLSEKDVVGLVVYGNATASTSTNWFSNSIV